MAANGASPLAALRPLLPPLIFFGLIGNLAVLVSPIFMMQVLDRVVPSGNLNTLMLLIIIAICALLANAMVSVFRDRALWQAGAWIDEEISPQLLRLSAAKMGEKLADLQILRQFLTSSGAVLLLSLPWVPVFLLALWLVHPLFVVVSIGVGALLFGLRMVAEYMSAPSSASVRQSRASCQKLLAEIGNHGGVTGLMSLGRNLGQRYLAVLSARDVAENRAVSVTGSISGISSFVQMASQISVLGLGAALVTMEQLTPGGMIGASIIAAKTVSTIENLATCWPGIREARRAYVSIRDVEMQPEDPRTQIRGLSGRLKADNLIYPRGGGAPPRLERVGFTLEPGECLAVVGESGSGKTTLLNALCGIEACPVGTVLLDQSDIKTLDAQTMNNCIGYLPQQARLLRGTLAENISRFADTPDDERIVAAARLAGVHGLISTLPRSYETRIPEDEHLLSAGQKQRVALARAVYETPKYLFLDEPNALLDNRGERQLADALVRLKSENTTIVMIVHRVGILGLADKIIVLDRGQIVDQGPRSEVMARIGGADRRLRVPVNPASMQDVRDWVARQFAREGDDLFKDRAVAVATELFTFTQQNGGSDADRYVTFTFRFANETECTLELSEPGAQPVQKKVNKIQILADDPTASVDALQDDERALANVIRLADHFKYASHSQLSAFSVSLNSASGGSGK